MSLLKKASIITTPTAYAEDYLYSIKPAYALGSELIINGNFANGTTNWTAASAVISASDYVLTVDDSANAGGDSRATQSFTTRVGFTYKVRFNRVSTTSTFFLGIGGGTGYNNVFYSDLGTDLGFYERTFVATNTTSRIALITAGTGITKFSDVSVKEITDADFDFDRNSTGTRVNEDYLIETVATNTPRIDYTNGEPSILLEPSRTNLSTNSEAFDSWTNGGTYVTANQAVSPDGNSTADQLAKTSSFQQIQNTATVVSGSDYSFSVFVKENTLDRITLRLASGSNDVRKCLDLSDLSVVDAGGNGTGFIETKVEEYPNGWYRYTLIATTDGTSLFMNIYAGKSDVVESGNIYIWGSQLEAGSYPTSYIPTAGSTVTRSADVADNAGNSDLFNDSEGVLYAEIAALSNDQTNRRITISDGTNTNRVVTGYNTTSNQIFYFVVVGSSTVVSGNYTSSDITEFSKIAIKYKVNDFALWVDGTERHTDSSGAVFSADTLDSLQFAQGAGGSLYFLGNVKTVAVFKEALSDTELACLTGYNNHELYMNYYNRLSYLGLAEEYNVESDINNYIL